MGDSQDRWKRPSRAVTSLDWIQNSQYKFLGRQIYFTETDGSMNNSIGCILRQLTNHPAGRTRGSGRSHNNQPSSLGSTSLESLQSRLIEVNSSASIAAHVDIRILAVFIKNIHLATLSPTNLRVHSTISNFHDHCLTSTSFSIHFLLTRPRTRPHTLPNPSTSAIVPLSASTKPLSHHILHCLRHRLRPRPSKCLERVLSN